MKHPANLTKVRVAVEEIGFTTEVQENGVSLSLVGHRKIPLFKDRPESVVGFQAYWTKGKNQDAPGAGWSGALIIDPIGMPIELHADYSISAQDAKNYGYLPEQAKGYEERRSAEYNDGAPYLRKRSYIAMSNEFFQWVDDWRRMILKTDDFKPLASEPKPKVDIIESGEWVG